MVDFEKLELSTETIRELSGDELESVAGGGPGPTGPQPTPPIYAITGTIVCPTGGTGLLDCDTLGKCG